MWSRFRKVTNWRYGRQLPVGSTPNMSSGGAVEKIMSITRQEFEIGLERLFGVPARLAAKGRYGIAGPGTDFPTVIVEFEELPKAVLGGLVSLPRARVIINLQSLSDPARAEFVKLFDKKFQRGGG